MPILDISPPKFNDGRPLPYQNKREAFNLYGTTSYPVNNRLKNVTRSHSWKQVQARKDNEANWYIEEFGLVDSVLVGKEKEREKDIQKKRVRILLDGLTDCTPEYKRQRIQELLTNDDEKKLPQDENYDNEQPMSENNGNDLVKSFLEFSKNSGLINEGEATSAAEPEDLTLAAERATVALLTYLFNGTADEKMQQLKGRARFIADYGEIGEFGLQSIPKSVPLFKSRTDKSISAEKFYMDNVFKYKPNRISLRRHDGTLTTALEKECSKDRLQEICPSLPQMHKVVYSEATARYDDSAKFLSAAFISNYKSELKAAKEKKQSSLTPVM